MHSFFPLGKGKNNNNKEPKRAIKMITDLEYKIPKEPLKELKLLLMEKKKATRLNEGSFINVLPVYE